MGRQSRTEFRYSCSPSLGSEPKGLATMDLDRTPAGRDCVVMSVFGASLPLRGRQVFRRARIAPPDRTFLLPERKLARLTSLETIKVSTQPGALQICF